MTTPQPELFRILSRQHQEVAAMLSQLATVEDPQTRGKLLPVLEQQLIAHSKAEEETFYRELDREGEKGEAKHAKHEHHDIEAALTKLVALPLDDDRWGDALEHLTETVKHHVDDEESDVFEAGLRSLDAETLDELAEKFTEHRRKQLERLGGSDDGYTELSKDELLAEARERDLAGRSSMSRNELISHLRASD